MTDNLPPLPYAWHTEDHLTDKSATTYSKDMAYRWECKGWPVVPMFTDEQMQAYARAALAQAQSCVPAEPELCDPSCGTYDLASMILSDCGHSSNNQRLLDRVAARIDKRLSAVLAASPQPQPVQPEDGGAHAAWTSHATNRKEKFTTLDHQNTFFSGWIACRTALAWHPPIAQPVQPTTEAATLAIDALEAAKNGLDWYRGVCPQHVAGDDDEMDQQIEAAIAAIQSAQAKPEQAAQPSGTQWQKRHPNRDGGAWVNTNEHDAKWWKANGTADWEIRVLYAMPVDQKTPLAAPKFEHEGMTVVGSGAQELGALMREQWANRGGVYPDGNPNAGGKA